MLAKHKVAGSTPVARSLEKPWIHPGLFNFLIQPDRAVRGLNLRLRGLAFPQAARTSMQPPTAPGLGLRLTADLPEKDPFVPGSGSVFGV